MKRFVNCGKHGIGEVLKTTNINGESFLEIQLLNKMKITIPENSGRIRDLMSIEDIINAKNNHKSYDKKFSNWNQLKKHFDKKLDSGKMEDLLDIVSFFESKPSLSFMEKELLNQAKSYIELETKLVLK